MTNQTSKMTNYRWVLCLMLFLATAINYMDRQVLSLTYPGDGGIQAEFHWTDENYGYITMVFSIAYAICQLISGKFIDWLGTKKGYFIAIGVWSLGACLHALCGVATEAVYADELMAAFGTTSLKAASALSATGDLMVAVATTSMFFFLAARCILALGEAGNFPAAIKVTAEYFPKKDRAFATAIFNCGSSIGALIAPFTIPVLAKQFGWEMAFIIIGALGFIWMGFWVLVYKKPEDNPHVNAAELAYINQDDGSEEAAEAEEEVKIPLAKLFTYRQTWAIIAGKFMTDGVWWFILFWTPAYLKSQFDINPSDTLGMVLIFVLYLITMLSILGGKLPTVFINRGMNPFDGRMRSMFIFALFPLMGLAAQPLGNAFGTPWLPILLMGIIGAAHQSWSANIYSIAGDLFPKSVVATLTGIGGMAGGVASALLNGGSGKLFTYASGSFSFGDSTHLELTQKVIERAFKLGKELPFDMTPDQMVAFVQSHGGVIENMPLELFGFDGKPAGYMIVFCICSLAYLVGWLIMKSLVPKYKPAVK